MFRRLLSAVVAGVLIGAAPFASAGAATVAFADDFAGTDGLITNEWASRHESDPRAVLSDRWEMTSGSLFRRHGAGWTGVPDGGSPDPASTTATGSAVFRLVTKASNFGDATVSFRLRNNGLVTTSRTPAVDWDGVHVFLRYQSQYSLYYVSVNRRDGAVVVKKKVPGGPSNGGTYYTLAQSHRPPAYGSWDGFAAAVNNRSDGAVVIELYDAGGRVLRAVDTGVGGPPIREPGRVGLRGDNADFDVDDVSVTVPGDGAPSASVPTAPRVPAGPPGSEPSPRVGPQAAADATGYRVLDRHGGVFAFGSAGYFGSVPGLREAGHAIPDVPVVALAPTFSGAGYWVLDEHGGVFSFGDAAFFGSVPALRAGGHDIPQVEAVDLVATPSGRGYWVLDEHGGAFSFGDAAFFGSVPALRAAGHDIPQIPVVRLVPTPSGGGYWVLDANGGVFSFGDAAFFGSVPALRAGGHDIPGIPTVAMVATPSGRGYWVLDEHGGAFSFGDAAFFGSVPALRAAGHDIPHQPIVDLVSTPSGNGYWVLDGDGGVFTFGDAPFSGSVPTAGVRTDAVRMATAP